MGDVLGEPAGTGFVREGGLRTCRQAVTAMFEKVRGFFGDFTDRALEQSSYMIDRLVERT